MDYLLQEWVLPTLFALIVFLYAQWKKKKERGKHAQSRNRRSPQRNTKTAAPPKQTTPTLEQRLREYKKQDYHRGSSRRVIEVKPAAVAPVQKRTAASPWAKLSRQEWRRAVVMKEILDPPRALRPLSRSRLHKMR
ncbi:hypothetical protein GCM10011571_15130 [Marinithermofilum abyssi]|uniref:Uncharacterized protein n=1 Tax=Marinithermofilum abyssi TaxID=1571185 RepID=A0A8J2YCC8_9BACL|nr:hypothetical protein [Marinithermofilum abyssi]GGE14641.1 hypothetical protein GCM10011571_15130 [Marinithermofilum abyssi]